MGNTINEDSYEKTLLKFLILLMLLSVAGISTAQTKSPDVARTVFSKMDANGDGFISVTEHAYFWSGKEHFYTR